MASIFTYEPEPPRVNSPWHEALESGSNGTQAVDASAANSALASSMNYLRLQAEPQEGPVEYKLHLLLRPRRKFRSTSTSNRVSGSKHSKLVMRSSARAMSESVVEGSNASGSSTPLAASTMQTRQHRLEQLTTQLLWRLQQSSPHHTSSASNTILPSLPEALPELEAPHQPAKLLHGLEESQGALYEIGVADDGTLIGLAEDEMNESLNNLRAMAACLGCTVDVLREELVGDCEWFEEGVGNGTERTRCRSGKLVVAEAFVKPYLQHSSPSVPGKSMQSNQQDAVSAGFENAPPVATEQLRVTLTGPTMCGKSTLLGTLTTSTLDNGRGQSRLSMLKHRHEITSGVTSSVTQELIGFADSTDGEVEVINFATANVASWIDMHVSAADSRLAFISDSAGHPRYRRTTVKGLIGWSPHWTLLCVPADDTEDTSGKTGSTAGSQQDLGSAVTDMDLSSAQLELCLRLHLPLVIVITKLDLASRSGLKGTLTKVLDALKNANRKPIILPSTAGEVVEDDLRFIRATALEAAYKMALPLLNDAVENVPIVLTSAVQGTGINTLHALLHELPIPTVPHTQESTPSVLFHIEDVYNKPAEISGVIVSGLLRSGQLSVGDSLVLGPFSSYEQYEDSEDSDERPSRRPPSHLPTSRSFPGALRASHLASPLPHFQPLRQQWRHVKITSVRNLRLPVHSLRADQVGTVALVPGEGGADAGAKAALTRIRKGMVLASIQPPATKTFVAEFAREDLDGLAVGNHVVVYIASVRASAKVVSARAPDSPADDEPFVFDEEAERAVPVAGAVTAPNLLVTFSFDAAREFVATGDKVLVLPGGGQVTHGGQERGQKGVPSLEGFVGVVRETHG